MDTFIDAARDFLAYAATLAAEYHPPMTTIWKWPLKTDDDCPQHVYMPAGTQLLTAQMQGDQLCLWGLVDPKAEPVLHRFRVFGTGKPIVGHAGRYVATAQIPGQFGLPPGFSSSPVVYHVFEYE